MSVQQDVVGWAAIRIDRVVTSGMWRFDGQQVPVDNNVWLLGDNHEVLVIDASHDLGPVREAIAGRRVFGLACGPVRTGQAHSDFATIIAQPKRSCCRCRRRREFCPAMTTRRPSSRNRHTWPIRSPGVTDPRCSLLQVHG